MSEKETVVYMIRYVKKNEENIAYANPYLL